MQAVLQDQILDGEGTPSWAIDLDAELLELVLIVAGVENLEKTPLDSKVALHFCHHLPLSTAWLLSPPDFPFSHSLLPSHTFSLFSLSMKEGQHLPGNLHVAMQSNDVQLLLLPYKLGFTGASCPINRSYPAAVPKR